MQEEEILMVVQVNGKLRGRISIKPRATAEEVKQEVLQNPRIQEALKGQTIKKFILVPQKLVNLVV